MTTRPLSHERKQASRRRVKAAILLASAGLHAVVFIVMFAAARGDLVSAASAGGGEAGPLIQVMLVRSPTAAKTSESPDLTPLMARLRDATAEASVPLPSGERSEQFQTLAKRLTQVATSDRSLDQIETERSGDAARRPAPRPLSEALGDSRALQADSDGETTGGASTGELWGRIQPCWRNIARRNRISVTLEVSLDRLGRIRTPPTVVRTNEAIIDEPRLQAEAGALAALAACLPRDGPRFGGQVHRLEFPANP